MRRLPIVTLLLLLSIIALSQHRSEYIFTNYSTSNGGLATNLINHIAQDEKGFMWLATYNGLQRFDGNRFITFRNIPNNNSSIPSNKIQALYFTKQDKLWLAGNNNKVGFFHTTHFTFKEIPIQNKKPESSYTPKHFLQTHNGQLLLYEEKGNRYRYDDKAVQFVPDTGLIKLPPNWKQNRITWDSFQHKYWIACDSGLVLYNPAKKQLSYRGHNAEQDPIIKQFEKEVDISNVFVSKNNTISFFTNRDLKYLLFHYNRNTGRYTVEDAGKKLGLDYFEIHGMFHQRNGRTWVHGVKLFAQWLPEESLFLPVSSFHNAEYKIKSNYVNVIFEDRESNLWVATDNGLFLFNPDGQLFSAHRLAHPMEKPNDDEDVLTMSSFQAKDENIYIGSWQKGLFIYDKHCNPKPLPKALQVLQKNITIWSIYEHKVTGHLWLSVEDQGKKMLAIYDPQKGTLRWINNSVFEGSAVLNIEEDAEGNLWLGTRGGHLVKWEKQVLAEDIQKGFVLVTKMPGTIREIYKDWQGYIWAITTRSGLLKVDPKKKRIVRNYKEELGSNQLSGGIVDLLQYNDSTLLLATETNLNLIHLKTNKI
ncbi:MAG TPA: two-component regulator propeller domain-containing protein, partial [Flavisolibacter sp.]|nr:two-component regulator propeller domain-containing protein [Flavisolibacter sp.]